METKTLMKVGRYIYECDPDYYASWAADEREAGRPTDLVAAGRYIYECDPEMFDRVAAF